MKVESIFIENFKRFDRLEVSFKNKILDEVSDRFLILGDNGSGKTTLQQAVALPLALATGRIRDIADFDWTGFLPGRYWRWGTPRIELEVSFEEAELQATREIAKMWYDAQPTERKSYSGEFVEPGDSLRVQVILNGDFYKIGDSKAEWAQFRGRYYTQWFINKGNQSVRSLFSKLPGIFWFDQFRNLGSNSNQEAMGDGIKERSTGISFELGVGRLRQFLINWRRRQESGRNYSQDYLGQLESLCFPRRLGKDACEQNIQTIVQQYKGDRIVTPENVLEKFFCKTTACQGLLLHSLGRVRLWIHPKSVLVGY